MLAIRFTIFLFFLFVSNLSIANGPVAFDSIYCKTLHIFPDAEPIDLLANATNLIENAKTSKEKMDALLYKTSLLSHFGAVDEAIHCLKRGDTIAYKSNLVEHHAYVHIMMSSLYRENGIYPLAKRALTRAKEVAKKVKNAEEKLFIQGSISLEEAQFLMLEGRYDQALLLLEQSRADSNKIKRIKFNRHLFALLDQLIAVNHMHLKQYEDALKYLKRSLIEIDQSDFPQEYLKGLVFKDIGNAYLSIQDSIVAENYLIKAFEIAQNSKHFGLRKNVYYSLMGLYKNQKDSAEYMRYTELFFSILKEEKSVSRNITNQLVEDFSRMKDQKPSNNNYYLSYALVCFGILSIYQGSTLYRRKRREKVVANGVQIRRRELPKFFALQPGVMFNDTVKKQIIVDQEVVEEQEKSYLPEETEQTILKGLQKFELAKDYLHKDISLTVLSAKMGTNHRYLSYVINKHREKDFTTYINELRINYIIALLHHKPESLKYKISYLAELGGFASHSRFTVIFKRILGISPSDYIQNIRSKRRKGLLK